MSPELITESARNFVDIYGAEDTARFARELLAIVLPSPAPATSDPLDPSFVQSLDVAKKAPPPDDLDGAARMSKAEFDRLVTQAEERLGKDVVAAVKRAHRNGRYSTDWAPILKELASR